MASFLILAVQFRSFGKAVARGLIGLRFSHDSHRSPENPCVKLRHCVKTPSIIAWDKALARTGDPQQTGLPHVPQLLMTRRKRGG